MTLISTLGRCVAGAVLGAVAVACVATSSANAMPVERLAITQSVADPEASLHHVQYSYNQYRSAQHVARYRQVERYHQFRHDQQVLQYRRRERQYQVRHDESVMRRREFEFRRHHYGY